MLHSNTAQGRQDRERTAQRPRSQTARSKAANSITQQHTTAEHTQRGETRQYTAPESSRPQDDGWRPRTRHNARQHQTEQNKTTQRTTTQRQAAQRAATRHSTAARDTPQHNTETRHQEPLLAWLLGCVCVCVRALLVPRHSWLGCAVWVCVLGPGFRLRPATPGWGVGVCVCLCACSACTVPILAGLSGVGVCAWARVSTALRLSWLWCWGVCVFVCALRLYPANPGLGAQCRCVRLYSSFGSAPPILAWLLGCVCVCVRALLVPRHSWLGSAVWVCVLGPRFGLRPATPRPCVGVCVCLCSCSACTLPILAGVSGVGVCAWARVSAALRLSWLGCWGVCVFVCALRLYSANSAWGVQCGCVWLGSGFGLRPATAVWAVFVCLCARSAGAPPLPVGACSVWVGCRLAPVPVPWFVAGCVRCPGVRHPVAAVAWQLALCLGCGRRRASLACLVAPRWCAAPCPVWSLSVLRLAFLTRWSLPPPRGLAPPDLLGGCTGHVEAGRGPGSLCLPVAAAEEVAVGSLCVVPVWGPTMGLSLGSPAGVGLGLRALRSFVCVDPVTDASGFPYRPSFNRGLGRCTGAVLCRRRHRSFRVGGRHFRVLCVCACACFLGWVGRAGLPGTFWCASPCPVALLAAPFVCSAPSGLGLPCLWLFPLIFVFPRGAPPLSLAFRVFWPWLRWALAPLAPPPLLVLFPFFFLPPPCLLFFSCLFFSFFRPPFFFLGFFFFFFFFCCVVVYWVCVAGVACPWLWGVLVCVVVGLVLWRGPLCACVRLFGAPCLCLLLLCCCLLCCACPVAPFWQRCSSPSCLWWLPFGVAQPLPLGLFARGFFFACRSFAGFAPPPGWLVSSVVLCRASCRVVLRSVVCLCCARCCVACLCRVGCLRRVVLPCCPVFVVLCCRAPLRSLLVFPFVWFVTFPWCSGLFLFLCSTCAVLCRVPALLLSVSCSLAPAALAGVLCCCLLCLHVCCWAWLSSVVSWLVPCTPARTGGVQAEHAYKDTHTPTPMPEVAGRSRNQSPSTHAHTAHHSQEWWSTQAEHAHKHTYTAHPSQEWRGAAETRVQARKPTPHIRARSGGALGSHGHRLAVAPCSGPLGSPSGSEGEPWGDSWPWCLGPGDSAALAHVGGNRRGVDLF